MAQKHETERNEEERTKKEVEGGFRRGPEQEREDQPSRTRKPREKKEVGTEEDRRRSFRRDSKDFDG